jgi:hypothetical protein
MGLTNVCSVWCSKMCWHVLASSQVWLRSCLIPALGPDEVTSSFLGLPHPLFGQCGLLLTWYVFWYMWFVVRMSCFSQSISLCFPASYIALAGTPTFVLAISISPHSSRCLLLSGNEVYDDGGVLFAELKHFCVDILLIVPIMVTAFSRISASDLIPASFRITEWYSELQFTF